jgi:hypothetical protein
MRGTKISLITLMAAGLVLAGCSSDDPDTTNPDTSTGTSTEPDDSPSEDASDDGDGEASGDLVAWAGELCGAVGPMQDEITALGEGMATITPDPDDPLAGMTEAFAQLGPVFVNAADAIEGIGPPPIENGDEAFDALISSLRGAGDVYAGIEEQLAGLDPADPEFQAKVQEIFAEVGAGLEESTQVLSDVFESPEMEAAFDEAPTCEGLDMS